MKITIGHLYPDLLNLYGDRGNIQCLRKRCEWRGIRAEVKEFRSGDKIDFQELDIVLLGGGSDREQMIVCNKLKETIAYQISTEEVQKWKSRGAALRKGVEESLPVFREKQERDERVYRPDTEESP